MSVGVLRSRGFQPRSEIVRLSIRLWLGCCSRRHLALFAAQLRQRHHVLSQYRQPYFRRRAAEPTARETTEPPLHLQVRVRQLHRLLALLVQRLRFGRRQPRPQRLDVLRVLAAASAGPALRFLSFAPFTPSPASAGGGRRCPAGPGCAWPSARRR